MVEADRSLLARQAALALVVFEATLLVAHLARELLGTHLLSGASQGVDALGQLGALVVIHITQRGAGRVEVLTGDLALLERLAELGRLLAGLLAAQRSLGLLARRPPRLRQGLFGQRAVRRHVPRQRDLRPSHQRRIAARSATPCRTSDRSWDSAINPTARTNRTTSLTSTAPPRTRRRTIHQGK